MVGAELLESGRVAVQTPSKQRKVLFGLNELGPEGCQDRNVLGTIEIGRRGADAVVTVEGVADRSSTAGHAAELALPIDVPGIHRLHQKEFAIIGGKEAPVEAALEVVIREGEV